MQRLKAHVDNGQQIAIQRNMWWRIVSGEQVHTPLWLQVGSSACSPLPLSSVPSADSRRTSHKAKAHAATNGLWETSSYCPRYPQTSLTSLTSTDTTGNSTAERSYTRMESALPLGAWGKLLCILPAATALVAIAMRAVVQIEISALAIPVTRAKGCITGRAALAMAAVAIAPPMHVVVVALGAPPITFQKRPPWHPALLLMHDCLRGP